MIYGAHQSAHEVVTCMSCGEEFVSELGRRCEDCFPEDQPEDYDADVAAYSRELEADRLGRPLFPNEY